MPSFHIHVVNTEYESSNQIDVPDLDHARAGGLKAALEVGAEELCGGAPFFGAEVRLEMDGEVKERMVIAMGTSRLR
jgi:hypothetical protein